VVVPPPPTPLHEADAEGPGIWNPVVGLAAIGINPEFASITVTSLSETEALVKSCNVVIFCEIEEVFGQSR